MKTFAFLTNPANPEQAKKLWPITRLIPRFPSRIKITKIKNITSVSGKNISGYLVNIPVLSNPADEKAGVNSDKIISAVSLAEKLGAEILGLGGMIAESREMISKKSKLPVTVGNLFTAWSLIEAVYRASRLKKIDLRKSTIAIIGANESIGSLCAKKLSEYCSHLILVDKVDNRLKNLKQEIAALNPITVEIEPQVDKAINQADIVITAALCDTGLVKPQRLKKGAILCDISAMLNNSLLSGGKDNGVLAINAGLIKLPNSDEVIPAPLAETMLLGFEDKFFGRYLSGNGTLEKLEEIANLAMRHGFEVWVPQAPVL